MMKDMAGIPEKAAGQITGERYISILIREVTSFLTSRHIMVSTDVTSASASRNMNAQKA